MMKRMLTLFIAAGTLAAATFSAQAVNILSQSDMSQLRPAGTVSASGARNLDDLQDKLAEKARQEGAKGFVVDSAGGDNHMYGTATIYK